MTTLHTERLADDPIGIDRAARLLAAGGLVAFPTETVYGLGGDARNDRAVARIFEAKGRPRFNPLIVHLPHPEAAHRYGRLEAHAARLAQAFWPGPLTLVVPLAPDSGLSPLVTAGLDSVALRVPAHPVAQALLRAFDGPLAAPSANPSGRVSPTRAEHVLDGLSGRIDAVVDGGGCAVGLESTIISIAGISTGGAPRLLRPGGLPTEAIEACLGMALVHDGTAATDADGQPRPDAPGQLASHYAPRALIRLDATTAARTEVWIGFGPQTKDAALNLSERGDLVEAAANLFHMLRLADNMAGPKGRIAVAPVPAQGLGRAINDRLRRAAAPRG